jgi:aerobic-type carbon monoxide dehydrogenase small subunit (CoxS/CutS family)
MPAVATFPATKLVVNGVERSVEADPERTLLSVLRDELALTGAKYGCGESQCGACTVLVDGRPVRSCTARLGLVAGRQITTIEGLEQGGKLHPLQEAFLETGAMQCGYCTCGMIMAGVALLREKPQPTDDDIFRRMNGHVCRCGAYQRIVAAIHKAAETIASSKTGAAP